MINSYFYPRFLRIDILFQDLIHQLNSAIAELQASKNTWLHKTWSSLRDVTKKDNAPTPDKEST